ncbi:hypothetical protein [Methanosarcina mazei]|uniref:hypothetical protein n=1 Tax=Methanosarcina mazei TaxID=2209 RepID=UPI0012D39002|nr:hypothetical protein [Methanosarcina mazei]
MGGSLAVFKLINPDKERLMKKSLNSDPQKNIFEFDNLYFEDSLGRPKSILNFKTYNGEKDRVYYKATHYTDTINIPIRIYLDSLEDSFADIEPEIVNKLAKGTKTISEYQEIYKFDVIIDFKTEEIFIFTKKNVANSFMSRFKKEKMLKYEKVYLDMKKIGNIPELSNIWGLWEDCEGKCKKKAYFGTAVHTLEELNKDNVTSYNVEYELDEENVVDLFITSDSRLSSRSKLIHNDELLNTYQELKIHLGTSSIGREFIGTYLEEN